MKNKPIYILSSAIGLAGGADKATLLLAIEYEKLGYCVNVFATSCETNSELKSIPLPPIINIGYRWRWPQISLIIKLFFHCIKYPPQFIHCVGLTYEIRLALILLKKYKLIVWETTEANKGNRFVDSKIIPLLPNAALMLAPSVTIKNNIKTTYNYNGLIEILPFWTKWEQPVLYENYKRTQKLLYAGRLDLDKGFDCLFGALRQIQNKIELKLNICGKGNIDNIKKLAYGLNNVEFHGFLDDDSIKRLYEQSDFLVLPSKHEGYPLSLVEAFGKSKPIMASKVGSIPEVFSNSKAAILFNANKPTELAECIFKCYNESDNDYNIRAHAARMLYETINNPNSIRDKLRNIIDSLSKS